jgi:tetratricopeptide (TPR) repeat protein
MRELVIPLLAGAASVASMPALAADTLKYGEAPPAWVVPQAIPEAKPTGAPVALLLQDQQLSFEPGKTVTFTEMAMRIQSPQGLAAGNLSFSWDPTTDSVTVNRLQIRRGEKIIDVLAGGQTFTILRRESNLEAAMLDGTLTANIQPEGLQEGDIIDLATTVEQADPVMKGHHEAVLAGWNGLPIEVAQARAIWPSALKVAHRESPGLPSAKLSARGGNVALELSARKVEPLIAPKGAPLRFTLGRIAELTDFANWSEVAELFAPLYREAARVPPSGPLRDEINRIKGASDDPRMRTEMALATVQDRIRYVALLMGQGGFVPATAESTWSRRFGDCKAKTALLLALLNDLDIEAEPVLVNANAGDAIGDRLPMAEIFNHVLVRAHIGGKEYWLDGTRIGDTDLDDIQTPDFGWGLPLIQNATLTKLVPSALNIPNSESRLSIDATAGIFAPAPMSAEKVFRGDGAVRFNAMLSSASSAQLDETLRNYWRNQYDFVTVKSATYRYDKAKRELTVQLTGDAKLDWKDNWFHVPDAALAYEPDFDRPAGPAHDAPMAVGFPSFERNHVEIRIPKSYLGERELGSALVHETLAGIEYSRTANIKDGLLVIETRERSLVPEISYADAISAQERLKAIANDDVYLPLPDNYLPTPRDIVSLQAESPASKEQFFRRGLLFLNARKYDVAIDDLSQAVKLDPNDVWAHANRAIAYVWKRDFDGAAKDIAAAKAIAPDNPVILRAQGLFFETKGDPKSAADYFAKAIVKQPGNSFARSHYAFALHWQGKNDEAVSELAGALTGGTGDAEILAARARLELELGKIDAAQKDIEEAKLKGGGPEVISTEAAIASAKGDYGAAAKLLSDLIDVDPQNGQAFAERAEQLVKLNRFTDALADSDRAIALGFLTPELRVMRANAFMLSGNRAAVAKEADALIRENPTSEFAFVAAAMTYSALNRREDAMKNLDRAIAINPAPYIYLNRARVRPRSDAAGRMADLDVALQKAPNDTDGLSLKASELVRAGKYQDAIRIYDQITQLEPDQGWPVLGKAAAMYKSGQTAEAEKVYALRRDRAQSIEDLNDLCGSESSAGATSVAAIKDCESALERAPANTRAISSMALMKLRLKDFDGAIVLYNRLMALRQSASAYMGRSIAHAGKGEKGPAATDKAQALAISSDAADEFADYGLKP